MLEEELPEEELVLLSTEEEELLAEVTELLELPDPLEEAVCWLELWEEALEEALEEELVEELEEPLEELLEEPALVLSSVSPVSCPFTFPVGLQST